MAAALWRTERWRRKEVDKHQHTLCLITIDERLKTGLFNFFILQADMSKAFAYAEKGCHLGNMAACINLSVMYSKGDGCPQDAAKSKHYRDVSTEMHKQLTAQMAELKFGEEK